MMTGKQLVGLYGVYAGLGVLTGLMFAKGQYYKGQSDAYADIVEDLTELTEEMKERVSENEEEEA